VLRQPDDLFVIAEVLVAQLRVPVEPEPAPDDAVEAADEEVGQEVRARLVFGAEDLVAVCAGETGIAVEVGAAVRVGDDDVVSGGCLVDGGADAFRTVVELRRHGADLDIPAAAGSDLFDMKRERSAADDDLRHSGNASWSMKRSLKSSRPESSTYSTSSRTAFAAARSVTATAAIFAPSPATFAAAPIRGSGSFGTSPILTALAAVRYVPNEPPRRTCEISAGSIPRSRHRICQPVAIEAFANCSSRTSRCDR